MRKKLITILVVGIVGTLALLGWFGYQSFTTGFSAKAEPHALEVLMARQVRYLAIPLEHRNKTNPVAVTPEILQDGLAHFADHCATCHANDGSGQTPIGKNVYPKAPDLRERATQNMSDGELFWVIHNGIRFTAMPAWGEGDPEQDMDSWKLVHFIRHLPQLTPQELERMKSLNPKTQHELDEQAALEKFLQGDDSAANAGTGHHH
ncbi:MAG: c-type cytochrome [Nitrospira sp.]|jgi:mono/diheme cytochrome c family protein|nr:c-type cytochrome [Nitrospira sp.]